jgi:hypothetical protein
MLRWPCRIKATGLDISITNEDQIYNFQHAARSRVETTRYYWREHNQTETIMRCWDQYRKTAIIHGVHTWMQHLLYVFGPPVDIFNVTENHSGKKALLAPGQHAWEPTSWCWPDWLGHLRRASVLPREKTNELYRQDFYLSPSEPSRTTIIFHIHRSNSRFITIARPH